MASNSQNWRLYFSNPPAGMGLEFARRLTARVVRAGMRFFRQLSEFRLKGDWEKDSFCHFHAVFEAQL